MYGWDGVRSDPEKISISISPRPSFSAYLQQTTHIHTSAQTRQQQWQHQRQQAARAACQKCGDRAHKSRCVSITAHGEHDQPGHHRQSPTGQPPLLFLTHDSARYCLCASLLCASLYGASFWAQRTREKKLFSSPAGKECHRAANGP